MKMRHLKYFVFAVLAVCSGIISSKGDSLITATITITNTAGNGSNWVVNGNTRTWTNNTGTPPADWITVGASIGATATNLYNSIVRYPYNPPLFIGRSSSNVITLRGITLTVSPFNYFTLSYVTNVGTNLSVVQVPFQNVDGATNRTNNAHWLVDALNTYPITNRFNTNAHLMGNYATKGASTQQVFVAPVQFNGILRAAAELHASNGFLHSVTGISLVSSGLVNYGNAIRSVGSGGNSFQLGSNAVASGSLSMAIGNNAYAPSNQSMAVGIGSVASNGNAMAIGLSATAFGASSVALGNGAYAYGENGIAFGQTAVATNSSGIAIGFGAYAREAGVAYGLVAFAETNSVALGNSASAAFRSAAALGAGATASHEFSSAIGGHDHTFVSATTTDTNQIRLGTVRQRISAPGLYESPQQTNSGFAGTNIARGSWSYPRFDLTTLSAGNNLAVPIGTNRFVRAGAGPASAATIVGMVGGATTGGLDGQDVVVFNDTAFTLTFAVNSVDPVPANRINTPTAADVSIPDQGWAQFFYDGTDARWKLINAFAGTNLLVTTTTTNAIYAVMTNGVLVSGAATNLNIIVSTADAILATNTSGKVDMQIVLAAGSGEANFNGEISKTNASMFGLVNGKAGVTNLIRSIAARNGLVGTNESGTNISLAIDPAVVASQANLTAMSNTLVISTQMVAAAIGNLTLTNLMPVSIGTNITVGTSSEHSHTLWTNASFQFVFTGTPLLGEVVNLCISNHNSSASIYPTNVAGIVDRGRIPAASITTLDAIPPLSIATYKFQYLTNLNNGVGTWHWLREPAYDWVSYTSETIATNSTVNSNLTVNFNVPTRELYLTNSISVTNFEAFATGKQLTTLWRVVPTSINRAIVWPAIGANFSIRFGTNAGSPLWTTLTNGTEYELRFSAWGSNITAVVTAWSYQ